LKKKLGKVKKKKLSSLPPQKKRMLINSEQKEKMENYFGTKDAEFEEVLLIVRNCRVYELKEEGENCELKEEGENCEEGDCKESDDKKESEDLKENEDLKESDREMEKRENCDNRKESDNKKENDKKESDNKKENKSLNKQNQWEEINVEGTAYFYRRSKEPKFMAEIFNKFDRRIYQIEINKTTKILSYPNFVIFYSPGRGDGVKGRGECKDDEKRKGEYRGVKGDEKGGDEKRGECKDDNRGDNKVKEKKPEMETGGNFKPPSNEILYRGLWIDNEKQIEEISRILRGGKL